VNAGNLRRLLPVKRAFHAVTGLGILEGYEVRRLVLV
jgi:hypothetical protein